MELQLEGLSKTYGTVQALRKVTREFTGYLGQTAPEKVR